jgi:hypothetical protein
MRNDYLESQAELNRVVSTLGLVQGGIADAKREKEESIKVQRQNASVQEKYALEKENVMAKLDALHEDNKRQQEKEKGRIHATWKEHQQQIEKLRERHEDQNRMLQDQITDLCGKNGTTKGKLQRCSLESQEWSKKYASISEAAKKERKGARDNAESSSAKQAESAAELEREKGKHHEMVLKLQSLSDAYANCRHSKVNLDEKLQTTRNDAFHQKKMKEQELSSLRRQLNDAFAEKNDLESKIATERGKITSQLEDLEAKCQREVTTLKSKLRRQESREMEKDRQRKSEDREYSSALDDIKTKARKAIDYVDLRLCEERALNQELLQSKEQLVCRISVLTSEHARVSLALQEARDKVQLLDMKSQAADDKRDQLEKNLSNNLRECQNMLRDQTKLKFAIRERELEIENLRLLN